jgi:hypothetical protein
MSMFSILASQAVAVPLPPTPTGLSAFTNSSSQIIISWNFMSNTDSYDLQRSTSPPSFSTIYNGPANNFDDNALLPNTTYYYRVRGINVTGFSPFSSTAFDTTFPDGGFV